MNIFMVLGIVGLIGLIGLLLVGFQLKERLERIAEILEKK